MKSLPLKNPTHIRLESGFRDWLELMGYAASSVYGMPNCLREFLYWLEQENKTLETMDAQQTGAYFFHLKKRRNKRRTGTIRISYVKKHLQALRRFGHYLKETDQGKLEVDYTLATTTKNHHDILTREEIERLYTACTRTPMGLRDRAMLSIYYGCGLRRTEGVMLDVTDFLAARNLLYVRRAKGYKERYVPLNKTVAADLKSYLNHGRPSQLSPRKYPNPQSFFISKDGRRPQGQTLYLRLKILVKKADIEKTVGLHTLRHSIATHLLESGMELYSIASFLGHSSLESTQIYTKVT